MPTGIEKLFGGRLPERRQEGIDLTGRSGGESRQNIFKPVAEADVVGFARCRERVEDSQALPAGFTSGEQTILSDNGNSAIESLGGIVVDIEAAVL